MRGFCYSEKTFMKKFEHGFVLGKFMPLHAGHIHLLKTAKDASKKLTILLYSQSSDPIPGAARLEWIKETFPKAQVLHHQKPLPRDEAATLFWDIWRDSILSYCSGETFDAIFSSEDYGERLARELGATHVLVDQKRIKFPVSGTDIRNDPKKFWEFIPEIVRPYYQ